MGQPTRHHRVHSAGQDFEALDLFRRMRHRGDLSVRMYIGLLPQSPELRHEEPATPSNTPTRNSNDDWIDAGAVQIHW